MATAKAREEAEKRALKAASERVRYNAKKCASIAPLARKAAPRQSTMLIGTDARSYNLKIASKSAEHREPVRKLAKRRKLTSAMADAILRIASQRVFKKSDIWGGEQMSRAEWRAARTDYKELRKVNAMRYLEWSDNLPVAPLFLQRRWARISRQYMAEYCKGSAACDAITAVQNQRSKRHRDTNDSRSKLVEACIAAMSCHL